MTNIDQFESVFKSADKAQFRREAVELTHFLFVTDVDQQRTRSFSERVGGYLDVLCDRNNQELTYLDESRYGSVEDVLQQIAKSSPDVVVTYRNLNLPSGHHPFSLGVYLDVLTQATRLPIFVFPEPDSSWQPSSPALRCVMAITDHLTTDSRLVNIAAQCTRPRGTLWLTHVEDEAVVERILNVISKIPGLDTDVARDRIPRQLLKEPRDYIRSCRKTLSDSHDQLKIEEEVRFGHTLADYKQLIDQHHVDLLVMNSKDDEQLAMHGIAYPLTVELRDLPLLLV